MDYWLRLAARIAFLGLKDRDNRAKIPVVREIEGWIERRQQTRDARREEEKTQERALLIQRRQELREKRVLNTGEAAEYMRVSEERVRYRARRGELSHERAGREYRFRVAHLDDHVEGICAYCGQRLNKPVAQQCFTCGMNWRGKANCPYCNVPFITEAHPEGKKARCPKCGAIVLIRKKHASHVFVNDQCKCCGLMREEVEYFGWECEA